MKAVERLKAEHDLIERGLALLEKAVARLEAGQSLPKTSHGGQPTSSSSLPTSATTPRRKTCSSPSSSSGAFPNRAGQLA